jgi:ubiquinone/menaquinone biosynthesis C-methylase UbiE
MPDLLSIFQREAPKYDLLVSREDYQGNLLRALCAVAPFHGKRVVEFGAGTGRVTLLLAPIVKSILAFDSSEPMIKVAEERLQESHLQNWQFAVADHREVPAESHSADIAVAGWSICCLAVYEGKNWQRELRTGLAEMQRVVAPGGTIVIIETLGTGYSSPNPPEGLRPYYGILDANGFRSTWIRTDYRFSSMDEAMDLTTFFFGNDPVSAIIERQDGVFLPECTGIWWRQVEAS